MKKSIWTNKKHPKKTYIGVYVRDSSGEQNFVLKCQEKAHRVTFESWQMAKAVGWVKQRAFEKGKKK